MGGGASAGSSAHCRTCAAAITNPATCCSAASANAKGYSATEKRWTSAYDSAEIVVAAEVEVGVEVEGEAHPKEAVIR